METPADGAGASDRLGGQSVDPTPNHLQPQPRALASLTAKRPPFRHITLEPQPDGRWCAVIVEYGRTHHSPAYASLEMAIAAARQMHRQTGIPMDLDVGGFDPDGPVAA